MEPVGLAVGIVGLAGLFDATMNAIDRIKTYKEHDRDAERLASQIQGHKVALQDWRAKVGLDAQNGLDGKHSRRLDETKTRESVERLLKALLRDLGSGDDGGIGGALAVRTANNDQEAAPTGNKEKAAGKSRKLGWALGGKKDHVEKEAAVRELLKQLRILVPPDEERLLDSQRKTDEFHALYTGMISSAVKLPAFCAEYGCADDRTQRRRDARYTNGSWGPRQSHPLELYAKSVTKRLTGPANG